jgi:hypothetical protein
MPKYASSYNFARNCSNNMPFARICELLNKIYKYLLAIQNSLYFIFFNHQHLLKQINESATHTYYPSLSIHNNDCIFVLCKTRAAQTIIVYSKNALIEKLIVKKFLVHHIQIL